MYDQKQNCDHWTELLDYKYMTDMIWIIQLIKLFCQTCLYLVYTQKNTICLKNPSNTLKSFKFCCCSVAQLCPTLWDPMDCSTPGFSVLHHPLELAQTHVHWVREAIQPACPLSSHPLLFLPSIFPSMRVFSNESAHYIRWPTFWSFSISPSNKCSELISFRIDWLDLLAV